MSYVARKKELRDTYRTRSLSVTLTHGHSRQDEERVMVRMNHFTHKNESCRK